MARRAPSVPRLASLKACLDFFQGSADRQYWWYRGQRDARWEPSPGLFRVHARHTRRGRAANRYTESIMLRKFKEAVRLMLPIEPRDDWEWLALAQHHGLLTRLLDWTRNPMVALYFAVEKAHDGDSAVWCVRPKATYDTAENAPWEIEKVWTVYLPHVSPRIGVQKGVFTAHPFPELPPERWGLPVEKVIIAAEARVEIRSQLRAFGVDRASLFPDFDGIASSINNSECLVEADEKRGVT